MTRLSQIEAARRSEWSCLAATCHARINDIAGNVQTRTDVVELEGNRVHGREVSTGRNKPAASRQVCMDLRAFAIFPSFYLPTITPLTTCYVFSARTPERLTPNYDDPRYLRASIVAKPGSSFSGLPTYRGSDRCINERRTLGCLTACVGSNNILHHRLGEKRHDNGSSQSHCSIRIGHLLKRLRATAVYMSRNV